MSLWFQRILLEFFIKVLYKTLVLHTWGLWSSSIFLVALLEYFGENYVTTYYWIIILSLFTSDKSPLADAKIIFVVGKLSLLHLLIHSKLNNLPRPDCILVYIIYYIRGVIQNNVDFCYNFYIIRYTMYHK